MNNESASSAMSYPSTAMFDKITGADINESKFINSGHDTTVNKTYYNLNIEVPIRIPDVIGYIKTAAEHFVALTRSNQLISVDCSGSVPKSVTTAHTPPSPIAEGYRVDADVSDIVSSLDPSSLPVASTADRYARSMLQCLYGYPLYEPRPFSGFSKEYSLNGVNIGDVGFVRKDGTFDFLFNVCLPQNSSIINPPNLPDGFCLKTPEHSETRPMTPHPRKTSMFHSPTTRTNSGEYRCEGSEGAILELPEGAIEHEAVNVLGFKNLAACQGVEWYKYTMILGRDVPNGSLYLITSYIKCTQWGIAVFDRPCAPGQGLRFGNKFCFPFCKSTPKYHWKASGAFTTKVADPSQHDAPNQCVFLQGYKITIRQDIFDNLRSDQLRKFHTAMTSSSPQAKSSGPIHVTRQKATRIRGGAGSDPSLRRLPGGSSFTQATNLAVTQSDEVVLHANFNSSLVHPSDFINTALLSQNPDAKVAVTHDDVWCDLLRDNFPELNHATLINIARSYTNTVDEYGCVSLEKTRMSDSSNDESSPGSPDLQGPIQQKCPTTPNEENSPVPIDSIENTIPSVQEKNDNVGHAILYEVHGDTVIFQFGDGHYTEQERGMIRDQLSNVTAFTLRDLNDIMNTMKSHLLTSSILNLPNPQAAYSDYQIKNKHGSCVKGTRVPLLQEMADWISGTDETRMYVLSGEAEIGKSTVAYTIAARADALGLLGASFFFSRADADRENGKMFFTAIAYQLCLYNELFAKAIEAALLTKPLSDAAMKDPQEQLEALIVEPLRNTVRSRIRPILIVVDGLDECEEEDGFLVLTGLSQLVQDLPSFKVILTTRPQPHFDRFFHSQDDHKVFHVQHIEEDDTWPYHKPGLSQELAGEQSQDRAEGGHTSNIEDEVINDDTRLYLQPGSPQQLAREQSQDQAESGPASDTRIGSFVRAIGKHIIRPDVLSNSFSEDFNTGNFEEAKKIQPIVDLLRAQARSGPCFPGTREALLREMMDWMTEPGESKMYVLSGLAGIGKSTVVYTLATQAAELGLLGASFFFSRDEADRRNATKFFGTIAVQLCVYDETFCKAIGDVLLTKDGAAAITQDPQTQLQVLIVDPLRSIVQSRARLILIVVDALDECDDEDKHVIVTGLTQLVRLLPSFKIILTTRLEPLVDHLFGNHDSSKIFHVQNIEDKIVDGDIRLYLQHNLSLEQVQRHYPKWQWCASDEEIDSLVRAVGRLFIIASTAVRYICDKSASDPAAQMQKLLHAFAQDHTPCTDLDHFYTVILRNFVPENCDNDDIVSCYQSVIGAIISVQRPLPVSTLARLIGVDVEDVHVVLDNLQSVISLGRDDVPRIYHISFPDYLMDQARCKDLLLQIDPSIRHTQIATRCFEIMDIHLKYNILGLGDLARFMSNEDAFKQDGITDEQLQEKIPPQLRYACIYWANHLEVANIEDVDLMNGLAKFVDEHVVHWLEVLSLIGDLDLAHRAIRVVLKLLPLTSSDLRQLLFDALRFISKFWKLIGRSALHTYHSALLFTPTDSLLYRRYIKEARHSICSIEGGPEKWDALVANPSHGEQVDVVKFSLDGTLFVSCSSGKLKIWDAVRGTPISTIPGHRLAVANDFSTVASSEDKTITFYNVNGSARGTVFTTSSEIQQLALSSESSRVAAALYDGTISLWESGNAELIDSLDGSDGNGLLQFSPTGTRLAHSSPGGIILRDGISGEFIADLPCGSLHKFEFSGDGSRIVSVSSDDKLILWKSENGWLIGDVSHDAVRGRLAISANGSLLATADEDKVKLWSQKYDYLAQIKVLEVDELLSMAFSLDDILAIATSTGVRLYNAKTYSFVSALLFGKSPTALAFSTDCTRLAVGDDDGNVNLWDIRGIDASGPPSKGNVTAVIGLAISRDCSRLACGFGNGTVELWETRPTKRRIASHQVHGRSVRALGFGPDGALFASGSDDRTIKVWNGKDGSLRRTLNAPGRVQEVALSNNVLVAAGSGGVTLWSLDTLSLIHTFKESGDKVSIAEDSALIAVARDRRGVSLLGVGNHTTIATFDVLYTIHTMTFLPDNSHLVVQSDEGVFLSLNLLNKRIILEPTIEHLIRLPNTSLCHGVPLWHCQDKEQHYFAALFSQHNSPVPVLWIPREIHVTTWTQGSSMIALGCEDGRVIFLRLPTSHVS